MFVSLFQLPLYVEKSNHRSSSPSTGTAVRARPQAERDECVSVHERTCEHRVNGAVYRQYNRELTVSTLTTIKGFAFRAANPEVSGVNITCASYHRLHKVATCTLVTPLSEGCLSSALVLAQAELVSHSVLVKPST